MDREEVTFSPLHPALRSGSDLEAGEKLAYYLCISEGQRSNRPLANTPSSQEEDEPMEKITHVLS